MPTAEIRRRVRSRASRSSSRSAAARQAPAGEQRAVMILREGMRWKATEVAELLTRASPPSQRDSSAPARRSKPREITQSEVPYAWTLDAQRELLRALVEAVRALDMERSPRSATQERRSRPAVDLWLRGRDDVITCVVRPGIGCKGVARDSDARRNGSPAFGQYKPSRHRRS